MNPTLEIVEVDTSPLVEAGTTLDEAVRICTQAVRSKKWRNTKHYDTQSDIVDTTLFYAMEHFGEMELLAELCDQSKNGDWVYWLLHDRITLQILMSTMEIMDDGADGGAVH